MANPNDLANLGDLTLLPGTSFKIVAWNNFVATAGEQFTVLTWAGTMSGSASLSVDPAFAANGVTLVPQWNQNSLVLEAVPEPGSLILLSAGAIGLLGCGLRRTRKGRRATDGQASGKDDAPAAVPFPCGTSSMEANRRAA